MIKNIFEQEIDLTKSQRSDLKNQKAFVIWFTGLSGAGKSTIANALEKKLYEMGKHTYLLDGDNVRHGLSKNLGFLDEDRKENLRRVAEVARLMVDAGLIVIAAFISPFRVDRQMARGLFEADEFIEVFVDTPLDVAEQRDSKGLYKLARSGKVKNFTGIDAPYEAPEKPELVIDTDTLNIEQSAGAVLKLLDERGMLPDLTL